MRQFILRQNVLTDNTLILADKGKVFKGGYIAILKEYTFENAWFDKEQIKQFRNEERLFKYIKSFYPDFDLMDIEFN
jgi:hypothetical protein